MELHYCIFVFLVFCPKWEAWTAAPGFAHRLPGWSSSPNHQHRHRRRGSCGVVQRRIPLWKQGPAPGWHYKTFLPESCQVEGNNVEGQQFRESSEAGHWRSQKRYAWTKSDFEKVSPIPIASTMGFHIAQTWHTWENFVLKISVYLWIWNAFWFMFQFS